MWRSIGSGRSWRGEICNGTEDGTLYWVDSTIVPLRDNAGHIDRYVSISSDITNRKTQEERLRKSREEAPLACEARLYVQTRPGR
jgi:PAS domain S-box-containing protein